VFKVSNINFILYARIIAFVKLLRIPAHAASAFAFCAFAWDTFHIVAALTRCSLLTNVRKITSSSASLIDVTVTSLTFQLLRSFCCHNESATVNNAGVKFTSHKKWGCLDSNGVT